MRIVHYRSPASYRSYRAAYNQPWADFDSEIERLVSSAFGAPQSRNAGVPVDVHADKENVYVRAELPGVKRDQVDLEWAEDALTIAVRADQPAEGGTPETVYKRSLRLPAEVQGDKIAATLQDGILTVTLPRQEEVKPRKIAINVN